jgi:hypothetical protein
MRFLLLRDMSVAVASYSGCVLAQQGRIAAKVDSPPRDGFLLD